MKKSKYFTAKEFERCTPNCSIDHMEQSTLDMLDAAREAAGIPFILNCAFRSVEWDLGKGRNGKSAHTTGNAIDVRCTNSVQRFKIIEAAIKVGFKRIGIAKSFIHLDNSPSLPSPVIFHYL